MKFFKLSVLLLAFIIYHLAFPTSAFALDILPYFTGNSTTGNNMSSGEFFKTVKTGDGTFIINKSTDAGYYEQFKYDNKYIYHVLDTTWATENGNVTCDNGDTANLSYSGGSAQWVTRTMDVGSSFSSNVTVQGIDSNTGKTCNTEFNGSATRTVALAYQGCITFPGGATSDNAIELDITSGPGAGEQMFYDSSRGWIGFNRGEDGTGAYVTDNISSETHSAGECKTVTVKVGAKRCPAGYTCPNTSPRLLNSEVINLHTTIKRISDIPTGPTGPVQNELKTPNLDQEDEFYSTKEFFERALPFSVLEKFNLDPTKMFETSNFTAQVTHSGCGDVYLEGDNLGKNELDTKKTTDFSTKEAYDKQLLVTRFWQSILVAGKSAAGKFKATPQNVSNYPTAPGNSGDCTNDTSAEVDKTANANSKPPTLSLSEGILSGLGSLLCELPVVSSSDLCKPKSLRLEVQEKKIIPGEVAFDTQTVGQNGFLQMYKPASADFPKDKTERDESDKSDWQVLGKNVKDVGNPNGTGVTNEGVASFQTGTCDFYNSLYPASERPCNGTLSSAGVDAVTPPSIGTGIVLYDLPIHDTSTKPSEAKKQQIIQQITLSFGTNLSSQYWDEVVNKSIEKGINPSFALAVWIEESGASHYTNHFSCPPSETNFGENFACFIGTTNKFQDFKGWAINYCGASLSGYDICTTNQAGHDNSHFLDNLKFWYDKITL